MTNSSCCNELVSEVMTYVKTGSVQPYDELATLEHDSLHKLKTCAESDGCSICCVLWAAVKKQCPHELLQLYLDEQEPTDGLPAGRLVIRPNRGLANFAICAHKVLRGKAVIGNVDFSSEYGELDNRFSFRYRH
jgi:hypothetical protein